MKKILPLCISVVLLASGTTIWAAKNETPLELRNEVYRSLAKLHVENPQTARLGRDAYAVAVFPQVRGFGFLFGAESGKGILFLRQAPADYYKIQTFSGGLQFGWRKYGLAIFFLTEAAFDRFIKSKGTEFAINATAFFDSDGYTAHASKSAFQPDVIKYVYGKDGIMFHVGPTLTQITEASFRK